MTHIRGKIAIWNAIFSSFEQENGELILYLNDGTSRKMEDWGKDTLITLDNIKVLKRGDHIKVMTWGNRSIDEWFCDVKKLNFK